MFFAYEYIYHYPQTQTSLPFPYNVFPKYEHNRASINNDSLVLQINPKVWPHHRCDSYKRYFIIIIIVS